MTPSEQILELAKSKLGTDFTNDMVVSDDVSCAYAVTTILNEQDPSIPIIHGTYLLYHMMEDSPKFERIYEPEPGCIVIAATGTNTRPEVMPHGHTGIYLTDTLIASNNSNSGLWEQNYSRESFRQRYYYKGGFPIKLYRKVV